MDGAPCRLRPPPRGFKLVSRLRRTCFPFHHCPARKMTRLRERRTAKMKADLCLLLLLQLFGVCSSDVALKQTQADGSDTYAEEVLTRAAMLIPLFDDRSVAVTRVPASEPAAFLPEGRRAVDLAPLYPYPEIVPESSNVYFEPASVLSPSSELSQIIRTLRLRDYAPAVQVVELEPETIVPLLNSRPVDVILQSRTAFNETDSMPDEESSIDTNTDDDNVVIQVEIVIPDEHLHADVEQPYVHLLSPSLSLLSPLTTPLMNLPYSADGPNFLATLGSVPSMAYLPPSSPYPQYPPLPPTPITSALGNYPSELQVYSHNYYPGGDLQRPLPVRPSLYPEDPSLALTAGFSMLPNYPLEPPSVHSLNYYPSHYRHPPLQVSPINANVPPFTVVNKFENYGTPSKQYPRQIPGVDSHIPSPSYATHTPTSFPDGMHIPTLVSVGSPKTSFEILPSVANSKTYGPPFGQISVPSTSSNYQLEPQVHYPNLYHGNYLQGPLPFSSINSNFPPFNEANQLNKYQSQLYPLPTSAPGSHIKNPSYASYKSTSFSDGTYIPTLTSAGYPMTSFEFLPSVAKPATSRPYSGFSPLGQIPIASTSTTVPLLNSRPVDIILQSLAALNETESTPDEDSSIDTKTDGDEVVIQVEIVIPDEYRHVGVEQPYIHLLSPSGSLLSPLTTPNMTLPYFADGPNFLATLGTVPSMAYLPTSSPYPQYPPLPLTPITSALGNYPSELQTYSHNYYPGVELQRPLPVRPGLYPEDPSLVLTPGFSTLPNYPLEPPPIYPPMYYPGHYSQPPLPVTSINENVPSFTVANELKKYGIPSKQYPRLNPSVDSHIPSPSYATQTPTPFTDGMHISTLEVAGNQKTSFEILLAMANSGQTPLEQTSIASTSNNLQLEPQVPSPPHHLYGGDYFFLPLPYTSINSDENTQYLSQQDQLLTSALGPQIKNLTYALYNSTPVSDGMYFPEPASGGNPMTSFDTLPYGPHPVTTSPYPDHPALAISVASPVLGNYKFTTKISFPNYYPTEESTFPSTYQSQYMDRSSRSRRSVKTVAISPFSLLPFPLPPCYFPFPVPREMFFPNPDFPSFTSPQAADSQSEAPLSLAPGPSLYPAESLPPLPTNNKTFPKFPEVYPPPVPQSVAPVPIYYPEDHLLPPYPDIYVFPQFPEAYPPTVPQSVPEVPTYYPEDPLLPLYPNINILPQFPEAYPPTIPKSVAPGPTFYPEEPLLPLPPNLNVLPQFPGAYPPSVPESVAPVLTYYPEEPLIPMSPNINVSPQFPEAYLSAVPKSVAPVPTYYPEKPILPLFHSLNVLPQIPEEYPPTVPQSVAPAQTHYPQEPLIPLSPSINVLPQFPEVYPPAVPQSVAPVAPYYPEDPLLQLYPNINILPQLPDLFPPAVPQSVPEVPTYYPKFPLLPLSPNINILPQFPELYPPAVPHSVAPLPPYYPDDPLLQLYPNINVLPKFAELYPPAVPQSLALLPPYYPDDPLLQLYPNINVLPKFAELYPPAVHQSVPEVPTDYPEHPLLPLYSNMNVLPQFPEAYTPAVPQSVAPVPTYYPEEPLIQLYPNINVFPQFPEAYQLENTLPLLPVPTAPLGHTADKEDDKIYYNLPPVPLPAAPQGETAEGKDDGIYFPLDYNLPLPILTVPLGQTLDEKDNRTYFPLDLPLLPIPTATLDLTGDKGDEIISFPLDYNVPPLPLPAAPLSETADEMDDGIYFPLDYNLPRPIMTVPIRQTADKKDDIMYFPLDYSLPPLPLPTASLGQIGDNVRAPPHVDLQFPPVFLGPYSPAAPVTSPYEYNIPSHSDMLPPVSYPGDYFVPTPYPEKYPSLPEETAPYTLDSLLPYLPNVYDGNQTADYPQPVFTSADYTLPSPLSESPPVIYPEDQLLTQSVPETYFPSPFVKDHTPAEHPSPIYAAAIADPYPFEDEFPLLPTASLPLHYPANDTSPLSSTETLIPPSHPLEDYQPQPDYTTDLTPLFAGKELMQSPPFPEQPLPVLAQPINPLNQFPPSRFSPLPMLQEESVPYVQDEHYLPLTSPLSDYVPLPYASPLSVTEDPWDLQPLPPDTFSPMFPPTLPYYSFGDSSLPSLLPTNYPAPLDEAMPEKVSTLTFPSQLTVPPPSSPFPGTPLDLSHYTSEQPPDYQVTGPDPLKYEWFMEDPPQPTDNQLLPLDKKILSESEIRQTHHDLCKSDANVLGCPQVPPIVLVLTCGDLSKVLPGLPELLQERIIRQLN